MSLDTEALAIDEWETDIYKGSDFKFQMIVATNGVAGYEAGDTFEGAVTLEPETATGEDLVFVKDNPTTGLLTVKLPKAQTSLLDINEKAKAAGYLKIKWNRTTPADNKTILDIRPIIHAEGKT